jgi:hypothetical protein
VEFQAEFMLVKHGDSMKVKIKNKKFPANGFQKGNTYRRSGRSGRKPGTPNKFTTLKNAFIEAFQNIGGAEALVEFAETDNRSMATFLKIVGGMLPKDMNLTVEGAEALANNLQKARSNSQKAT